MFLRKIQKKNGRRYWYVLKSVYDRKRGYPVHKRVADLSGLSDEIVPAVNEKTFERTEQIAEINAEHEYVVTTPDKKQTALLNLLGIEMTCGENRRKKSSLLKKAHNST